MDGETEVEGIADECVWRYIFPLCNITSDDLPVPCFPPARSNDPWWNADLCKFYVEVRAGITHRDDTDECRFRASVNIVASSGAGGGPDDTQDSGQAGACIGCVLGCAIFGAMAARYDSGWVARTSLPCSGTGMRIPKVYEADAASACAIKTGLPVDLTQNPCLLGNWYSHLNIVGF